MTIRTTTHKARRNAGLRARIITVKAAHALLRKMTRAAANIYLRARANGERDTMVRASHLLHQLQNSHEQLAAVTTRLQTDIALAQFEDVMVDPGAQRTDW